MSQGTLAQLRNFSHADIKALALAGLVLFEQINAGRLIPRPAGNDGRVSFDHTIALINAGYNLQDAIHGADDDALPGLIQAFADLADIEVNHG